VANDKNFKVKNGLTTQEIKFVDNINTPNNTITVTMLTDKVQVAGTVSATSFVGPVTGNASTATALATTRNIALGGDVTGNANFDGSGNITITAAIADDSHNHIIANVDGLQTALDGKATTAQGALANSATQPGDNISTLTNNSGFTTNTGTVSTLADLGITSTSAEINKLDGLLTSTAELNYVDGVTSSIQTQLNGKAGTFDVFSGAYGDLTGKPTLGTAAATASTAYATSAQGLLAASATQPGDLGTAAA